MSVVQIIDTRSSEMFGTDKVWNKPYGHRDNQSTQKQVNYIYKFQLKCLKRNK